MMFYHGTMAFRAIVDDLVNGPTIAVQRIKDLIQNPDWEVCCSDIPLGNIGVILDGTPVAMFDGDVSSIVKDGHRVRSTKYGTQYKELSIEEWATCISKTHKEAWVTNYNVQSIWITESFEWENEELLPILTSMGLPIEVIEG
jgi:hypothetical protein